VAVLLGAARQDEGVASTAPTLLPFAHEAGIARDARELTVAMTLVARGLATRIALVGLENADEALRRVGSSAEGVRVARRRRIAGPTSLIVEAEAR
jgi:hypothetical protein